MCSPLEPIIHINAEHVDEATDLLARAFADDPLMQVLFHESAKEGIPALMRFACQVRLVLGWPLLGYQENTRLLGVVGLSEGMNVDWPEELHLHYKNLKDQIGSDAIDRLEQYSEIVNSHRPETQHIYVAVLGVDPSKQGSGIGRALLEASLVTSQHHPQSRGLYLDTENPANVPFYKRMGYQITHQEEFDGVTIWFFHRNH